MAGLVWRRRARLHRPSEVYLPQRPWDGRQEVGAAHPLVCVVGDRVRLAEMRIVVPPPPGFTLQWSSGSQATGHSGRDPIAQRAGMQQPAEHTLVLVGGDRDAGWLARSSSCRHWLHATRVEWGAAIGHR